MAEIAAIGTAVPSHRYAQDEVAARCRGLFQDALTPARRESLFANAGVGHRRFVEPMDYYLPAPPFSRRNGDYLRHALPLAEAAIAEALARGGASHADVSHLVSVTTTGLLTPSLEARLAARLPFPRRIKRTPLFGAGCAGGAVALARAFEYLKGHPRETVLALSTELCSLSFLPGDGTVTQLVAAALFGDGAAAALLRGSEASGGGPEFLAAESLLFDDSLDVMGWDFGEDGMRLVLSAEAPRLVERRFGAAVDGFLERNGARRSDVSLWALHPGSRRIIEACEKALGLTAKETAPSRRFLAEHGNLSSASVLFILRDVLETAPRGSLGVLAALGPGFACETLLFRVP
jgi:alkylresorcinol/alkylpyrone synthase